MKIIEISHRDSELIQILLKVWEKSVRATHLFLSNDEIKNIKQYVPQALNEVSHLIIIENKKRNPVGFMRIENESLEMLFITPEEREKGFEKQLIQYGIEHYAVKRLAVNEQNPKRKDFMNIWAFKFIKEQTMMNRETLIHFYT